MIEGGDPGDLLRGQLEGVRPVMVEAGEVPEPYHGLLCHDHDMTSTLARFHGGPVSLEVLDERAGPDDYRREVILRVHGKAVEYGVIRIFLEHFPEKAREDILAGGKPLGAILTDENLVFESHPVGFLKIDGATFHPDFFPSSDGEILYGRYNRLLGENQVVLARILEILPIENP